MLHVFGLGVLGVAIASTISFRLATLRRNVVQAKKTGLPYVLTPALENEIVAQLLTPFFRWLYFDYLLEGNGWPRWCRFMIRDWGWEDGGRAHREFGDIFLVVSTAGIICYSTDATLNHDVTAQRHTFTKPHDKYRMLEPFGPNVATVEGKEFQTHLRVTAPPFSDSSGINILVWEETVRQTRALTQAWLISAPTILERDVKKLALSVIARAGFGKTVKPRYDHSLREEDAPTGYSMSLLRAMSGTTANLVPLLVFPRWFLPLLGLGEAAASWSNLEKYLKQTIAEELAESRTSHSRYTGAARGNLLSSLVQESAAAATKRDKEDYEPHRRPLSEDEIMGNLFIFLFGGNDTSAYTIIYGLAALALYPEIQDRVCAEIDLVCKEAGVEHGYELDYVRDSEKLSYTNGFIYEVLRLFPPVTWITKMTHNAATVMTAAKSDHQQPIVLPSLCRVYLNVPATHYSSKNWQSPRTLDPSRWITSETRGEDAAATRTRLAGRYLAFSEGSRSCLGRKFANVEVMAFLAVLLRAARVELRSSEDRYKVERDLFARSGNLLTLAPISSITVRLIERR